MTKFIGAHMGADVWRPELDAADLPRFVFLGCKSGRARAIIAAVTG